MPQLDLAALSDDQRPTAAWAGALLHALARDEAAGRRAERLTEAQLATWTRFRGRLTATALVELVFEDAAVLHRIPFDPARVGATLDLPSMPSALAESLLARTRSLALTAPGPEYILDQARLLGVPTKLARSELHVVKPHQKVLELPGTGGQLAHHLVSSHPGLSLQDNVTIACATWQELTLAGVVALELGAPHSDSITSATPDDLRQSDHPLRKRTFDFVVGLHPDKGGLFRVHDQLAIWYPNAKLLLV